MATRSFLLVCLLSSLLSCLGQKSQTNRQVLLQGFWWDYYHNDFNNNWSNYLVKLAPRLKEIGLDAIYIPPSVKNKASFDMGYAPFDHYDLGDKYQKGFLGTKFGDKDELLRMVAVYKANGIDVIQDIVLNHITGAGSVTGNGGRDPAALDDGSTDKFKNFRYVSFNTPALNSTAGNYTSRQGRFYKNWQNFYPNNGFNCCTNEINTPYWGPDISFEGSSFGQSSNCNYNPVQSQSHMREGMRNWLMWYKKQVGWEGVRIDAIKHFPSYVVEDFLWNLQHGNGWANGTDDMFAVGEWVGGASALDQWCSDVQNRAGTFDFSLRNALSGIIQGNGNFDLGTVPNYQQTNRQRTVPFVNNHDTFRPILDNNGNYNGWNFGSQLGPQIEPNDPRLSVVYAIAFAVDGAPMVYFEDLFDIGYNGNRYNHDPTDSTELPMRSDIVNIIWCHQNLDFKDGSYLVRWQENDALVIERDSRAIIAVNDHWNNWKNITGVQTNFSDGTILRDYSGANTQTITVYGGGKMDISIPPCDGSANLGRKGYCIWAPDGIQTNYVNPSESITQEWEMANDLGDSHASSLQQGGELPANSLDCRVVGKVYAKENSTISVELYPLFSTLSINLLLVDSNCTVIDSVSGIGNLIHDFDISSESWYTLKIRNSTSNQSGQKCWVKVNYEAPVNPYLDAVKNKCSCIPPPSVGFSEIVYKLDVFPNPTTGIISLSLVERYSLSQFEVLDLTGKVVLFGKINAKLELDVSHLPKGIYYLKIGKITSKFVKM
tara:strand:+ start:1651 stop:3963 length:2313 start_codon:yes stop_codon:yes gene_type:complete